MGLESLLLSQSGVLACSSFQVSLLVQGRVSIYLVKSIGYIKFWSWKYSVLLFEFLKNCSWQNSQVKVITSKVVWYPLPGLLSLVLPYTLQKEGFPGGTVVKSLPANSGDTRDLNVNSGSGKSPGVGHGNPLQCSCLKIFMDIGAWQAAVHGITKSPWGCKDTTERWSLHTHCTKPSQRSPVQYQSPN